MLIILATLISIGIPIKFVLIPGQKRWMENKGYKIIQDFSGKLSQSNIKQPMMYERAQFMKYHSNYNDAQY